MFCLTFKQVTPSDFDRIATEVDAKTGVSMDGLSGRQKSNGFDIGCNYDPQAAILAVTVYAKPWFASQGAVSSAIDSIVGQPPAAPEETT